MPLEPYKPSLSNVRCSDLYLISYCDCGDVRDYFYFMYINGPRWTDSEQAALFPDCKAVKSS